MNITGDETDKYRFRTSPLRNVELTSPYGHDGAITNLREFIAHYSDSDKKLLAYDPLQLDPALDLHCFRTRPTSSRSATRSSSVWC